LQRLLRRLRAIAVIVVALAGLSVLTAWLGLRASLPVIEGRAALPGLKFTVSITRDEAGVPTITAQNRTDLARGLGYAHGQDRYFQMDLLRRAAAGELSALIGPGLIDVDREMRVHRFRAVARAVVSGLDAPSRALLDAYVAGVNAGLASLHARPFEYWVLRAAPQPWSAEDSVLCVHAMYLQLQDSAGHLQLQRGLLRATLPEALWRFLESDAPEWDAAIDGSRGTEPIVPPATAVDLRALHDLPVLPPDRVLKHLNLVGSNNWAVAGSRTANGAAIVANDMHLDFRVPNIWYRARLIQAGADAALDETGVTLPGTPSMVAGSNGWIAWGFTNSYGEFAAVIRLVPAPGVPDGYLTALGAQEFRYVDEPIEVKGAATQHLRIALTPWGPVVGHDWEGHAYVLNWAAHDPDATNLRLLELEQARTVNDALGIAAHAGIPAQNFMVADKSGSIGWTIAGRLPQRLGTVGSVPQLSTEPRVGLGAWLPEAQQPRVIDPAAGLLWSANARVIGGAGSELIGDDGLDRGARASLIHADLLAAAPPFTPLSSLSIQLDDRASFLERWRGLMNQIIDRARAAGNHEHDPAHDVLAHWSGHAQPADAAYRLVNLFRAQVEARAFFMLVAPARQRAAAFRFEIPSSFEGPLWRLMQERPVNLLASYYADWDEFLIEALRASEQLPPVCENLAACTWGQVNAVHAAHPLTAALPMLAGFLDMPTVTVPGAHEDMPRVQGTDFGASERFSVSPGHEREGYFHMPGGQSGHPLSPFYRAGFDAWAQGRPAPFLPGPPAHVLTLTP
jgi:penicillin G amidase